MIFSILAINKMLMKTPVGGPFMLVETAEIRIAMPKTRKNMEKPDQSMQPMEA